MSNRTEDKYAKIFREKPVPMTNDPRARTEQWLLATAQHFFGAYTAGHCIVGPGSKMIFGRSIYTLRSYARGKQAPIKYVLQKNSEQEKNQHAAFQNISHDNVAILPKFLALSKGKLMSARFDPVVVATDTISNAQKQAAIARDKVISSPQMKGLMQETGFMPSNANKNTVGMSQADIDVYNALGGYLLGDEIAMQDLIQYSCEVSGQEGLMEQWAEDLTEIGILAYRVVYDEKARRVYLKYVDPAGLILKQSAYKDHREMDMCGYVEFIPISQLKSESNFTDAEIREIERVATEYWRGFDTVVQDLSGRREDFGRLVPNYTLNGRIPVFRASMILGDDEKYIAGVRVTGERTFEQVGLDAKLSDRDIKRGKSFVTQTVQNTYSVNWIIGTDWVFNSGIDHIQVKYGSPGSKVAALTIGAYSLGNPSIVAQCISCVDDIQLAKLRIRDEVTRMMPSPGVAMDLALIRNQTQIGSRMYDAGDLLRESSSTGVLFYDSQSEFGLPGEGSNRPPIMNIPDNTLTKLQALYLEIDRNIDLIRQITGMNEVADGSAAPNDLLNGVTAQLNQASNLALSPLFIAMELFHKMQFATIGRLYQQVIADGRMKIAWLPAGKSTLTMIELDPDILQRDLEFSVRSRPSDEDKKMLLGMLQQKANTNAISQDGFLIVYNMIMDGDIKKAELFLTKYVAQMQAAAQQNQLQAIQAQTQANAASTAAAEEEKRKTLTLEYQLKGILEREKAGYAAQSAGMSHDNAMKQAAFNKQAEIIAAPQAVI